MSENLSRFALPEMKVFAVFLTGLVLLSLRTSNSYLRIDGGASSQSKEAGQNFFICEYDGKLDQNKSDCYKLLAKSLQSKLAWHFFGDSQMGKMTTEHFPHNSNITRKATGRCGFLDYVGMEKRQNNTWTKPNEFQGPAGFGFWHPYCSDLSGSTNTMYQSNGEKYMEYLAVEYANDVENQTPKTETTQETTALYLEEQLQNKNIKSDDNVCVINTGAHDQNLCYDIRGDITKNIKSTLECKDTYLQNVERYLKLLDPVCGYFVWVGISVVNENEDYVQRNDVGVQWNEGVKSLLPRLFPSKSFYVDMWHAGSTFPHVDNIHFEPEYYEGLAALFARLMLTK